MLWFKYGVSESDAAVSVVNGVGAALAFLSACVYYRYAHDRADVERKALQILAVLFAVFLAARVGIVRPSWIGFAAMFASIFMFASPLIALGKILKKHDASVLSLPTIAMTLAVSVSWTAYGAARRDLFIILPNAFGGLLGLAQLCIFFKYRPTMKTAPLKDRSSYDVITSP